MNQAIRLRIDQQIQELTDILKYWDVFWDRNKSMLYRDDRVSEKMAVHLGSNNTEAGRDLYYKEKDLVQKKYWKKQYKKTLALNKHFKKHGIESLKKY